MENEHVSPAARARVGQGWQVVKGRKRDRIRELQSWLAWLLEDTTIGRRKGMEPRSKKRVLGQAASCTMNRAEGNGADRERIQHDHTEARLYRRT